MRNLVIFKKTSSEFKRFGDTQMACVYIGEDFNKEVKLSLLEFSIYKQCRAEGKLYKNKRLGKRELTLLNLKL